MLLDSLAQEAAVELFGQIFNAAMTGDTTAMQIIADRIWPARRGRPIDFPCPRASIRPPRSRSSCRRWRRGAIFAEEAHAASMAIAALERVREPPPEEKLQSRVMLHLPANGRESGVTLATARFTMDPMPSGPPSEAATVPPPSPPSDDHPPEPSHPGAAQPCRSGAVEEDLPPVLEGEAVELSRGAVRI